MKEKIKVVLKNEYLVKYSAIILAVFSVIICLVILFTITIPQFQKIQVNRKELKAIQAKNAFYQDKYQKLGKIVPEEYKRNLAASLLALPDDKDIPGIIGQLVSLVKANNLTMDGMSFINPAAQANATSNYQVKLHVSGNLTDIKAFIKNLKNSPRLVKLSGLTLASVNRITGGAEADVEVTTFYESFPAQTGGIDADVKLLSDQDQASLSKLRDLIPAANNQPVVESTGSGKVDPFQ